MDITLLVYVEEEAYGKRLLRFLLGKRHPKLHPELVTRYEMIQKRLAKEKEEIVVLTDDRNVYREENGKVILLGERQSKKERKIFQYQGAEKIYEELLRQLELEDVAGWDEVVLQEEKGCYCLCSANRQTNVVMAGILSQYLAGKGKTLYLSLSEFPYYFSEVIGGEADFSRKGMGELIFLTDQEKFRERESRCREKFGRANLLAPIPYYKDLLDCTAKDWREIFRRLQEECGYDYLVVQMDELMECSLDVMDGCDRVWFLYDENILGEREKDVFSHYCQLEKRENLLKKICWVKIPDAIHEWKEKLEQGELGKMSEDQPLMAYMEQLVRGGKEDVCVVEDIG